MRKGRGEKGKEGKGREGKERKGEERYVRKGREGEEREAKGREGKRRETNLRRGFTVFGRDKDGAFFPTKRFSRLGISAPKPPSPEYPCVESAAQASNMDRQKRRIQTFLRCA